MLCIKGCCSEEHWMSHGLKYQQEGQKLGIRENLSNAEDGKALR